MPSEFDSAFREMLRLIVKEVVAETRANDSRDACTIESKASSESLLLNSREAAQALSISEPHLSRLTRSGVIPHLRVGKCLRYSVEALGNWVRQSASTEPPPRTITTKNLKKSKPVEKATSVSRASAKLRSKTPPKPADAKSPKRKTASQPNAKTRQTKQKVKQDNENEDRRNPFAELLAEVGIDRSSLPPLTNGELMRISETDIVTYHGWMHLNRPLPEEAREKLKKYFLGIVSEPSSNNRITGV